MQKNYHRRVSDGPRDSWKTTGSEYRNSAGKRNARLYQIRIYSVRELKQVMRVQLMPDNMHSSSGFPSEIRPIAPLLKKAGITGIFVGDSGGEVVRHSNRNILKISPNRFELLIKMLAA